eukprot:COSAG01_NODE_1642_length_9641_cov_14.964682_16_plen_47_part_00
MDGWLLPAVSEGEVDGFNSPTYIHAPQKIPTQTTKSILGGPAAAQR